MPIDAIEAKLYIKLTNPIIKEKATISQNQPKENTIGRQTKIPNKEKYVIKYHTVAVIGIRKFLMLFSFY